jgi:hypothetical protein
MANIDEWTRTEDKDADELHMYITGLFYDCTFKVGSESLGYQVCIKEKSFKYNSFI